MRESPRSLDYASAPPATPRWRANRTWHLITVCIAVTVLLAGVLRILPWLGFGGGSLQPATAQEMADAQASYDRRERFAARGDGFYTLTDIIDRTRRGVATEEEIVQRLGPPDGLFQAGGRRMLVYYYDRFGKKDWFAAAEFQGGVLVHFGYNGTPMLPPSQLLPYAPLTTTTTELATAPATAPEPATTRPS